MVSRFYVGLQTHFRLTVTAPDPLKVAVHSFDCKRRPRQLASCATQWWFAWQLELQTQLPSNSCSTPECSMLIAARLNFDFHMVWRG